MSGYAVIGGGLIARVWMTDGRSRSWAVGSEGAVTHLFTLVVLNCLAKDVDSAVEVLFVTVHGNQSRNLREKLKRTSTFEARHTIPAFYSDGSSPGIHTESLTIPGLCLKSSTDLKMSHAFVT